MSKLYQPRQAAGHLSPVSRRRPRILTPRERRPNCRVPLDAEIEAAAAEVRGEIAESLAGVALEMFPVCRTAELVVQRRFSHLAPAVRNGVLAEVVEAVLADPVARLALRQAEMHVS